MMSSKVVRTVLVLAAAVLPGLSLGQGDGTFESPLRIPGPQGVGVDAGDFNRDGKLDLAMVDGASRVTVLIQSARNRLDWSTTTSDGGGFFVRAADFDGDGDDDLVTADPGSAAYLLRSKGDGSFEGPLLLEGSQGARWLAVGDFNADGELDLATANYNFPSVSVYRGGGDGTLTHLQNYHAERPHSIAATDYDGDAKLDLLAALPRGLLPLKGSGDGEFAPKPIQSIFLGCNQSLFAADFDGDAFADLVSFCGIHLNRGDGTFSSVLNLNGLVAAVADLDGDRVQDLTVPGPSDTVAAVVVYRGKGDGTFHPPAAVVPSGAFPSFLLARDLDGDSRPDLIATDSRSAGVTVVWGRAGAPPTAGLSLKDWTWVTAAALGDLDADGQEDVLAASLTDSKVLVYLNPGRAPLQGPTLTIDTRTIYSALEVADLAGNGRPGLAGVNRATGQVLTALLDPTGRILGEVEKPAGLLPEAVAVERLDGGEIPDLAVACAGSNQVAVFLGLGGGEISDARIVPTIEKPRDLSTGDLDGDGRKDLVVISSLAVAAHFGKGNGDFEAPLVREMTMSSKQTSVAVAPVAGHGLEDILVTDSGTNAVRIWQAKPGREIEEMPPVPMGGPPVSLEAADLDGDGLLDLTTAEAGKSFTVRLQLPDGRWTQPTVYWTGLVPQGHLLADFNGDGALDALVYGAMSAVILVGGNGGPQDSRFLRGDTSGDGKIEISDAIATISRLFLGGAPLPCEDGADADDSGELNVTDPIATISYLFLGVGPLPPPGPDRCGVDLTGDQFGACAAGCP